MKFTNFCIKRPVFTVVLSLIIVVVGVIGYMRIPVRGYPNVNPPVISVVTTYPGASASIIESQITTPIENQLVGISGLTWIHSRSKQGVSYISLDFKIGVNIYDAVNDVRNRLAKITRRLPRDIDPPIIQKRDPNSLQTLVLSLSDPRLSRMAISDYATRNIVPEISQVLGVANVELYNERDYAMLIQLNPAKMAANNVTINDLTNVLNQQNINVPTGQIKNLDRYYNVLSQGQLTNVNAFRNLIIRDDGGYMLRFGDVAHVKVGAANTDSAMRINGREAIGIGVFAQANANPINVAKDVQKAIKNIQQTLPEGMELKVAWNDTTYLKKALHDVYHDMGFAVLLVVVVVMLFLGSWRSSLIPIMTIPICLIGVCALIYAFGYSINVFTLLALVLAIGLVVDDAIVILENIYRYIEQGLTAFQAAMKGSSEIAFAVIAMTLTLAAVYAPIGFATGMTGVIFRQFAFTLALAVIISGFVALTLSPMMCARLLRLPGKRMKITQAYGRWLDRAFERMMNRYRIILRWMLKERLWVVVMLIIVGAFGYLCFKTIPSELAPKEDMSMFMISIRPPANASFSYTDRYARRVERIVQSLPEVKRVMMMTNATSGGFAFVILKPWDKRKKSAADLIKEVTTKVSDIPGVTIGVFNKSQLGGGGKYGDSVRMLISSNQTYDQIYVAVEKFLDQVKENPGFTSATQDLELNEKQYVIKINRSLAAALHVSIQDVSDTLRTMLGGAEVTTFNWNNHDYNVVLQIPVKELKELQVVNQLYVRSQTGNMIPLSTLASIRSVVGPQQLPHDNRLRSDTITLNLNSKYPMGQAVHYLQRAAKLYLPDGYQFAFKGVAKSLLQSKHTMMGSFVLALIFIYLVLAAQFESFVDPFVIMLSVPLSIVGAIITLKITGNTMSIYTNIGFITLIGLIAKHGILITEFANQKRAVGETLHNAIVEAAALRLRPILMTTAAMVIGAIPLAFASGAGAVSRQHIGWVIVGGLLFGTFFSLIVVPIAYSYIAVFKRKFKEPQSA